MLYALGLVISGFVGTEIFQSSFIVTSFMVSYGGCTSRTMNPDKVSSKTTISSAYSSPRFQLR